VASRETAKALTLLPGQQDRCPVLGEVPTGVGLQQGDAVALWCEKRRSCTTTAPELCGSLLRGSFRSRSRWC
jgi:hypothetical protein